MKKNYLIILQTMEDEDDKSLKRVEDGEGVCHGDGLLAQVQQPEGPGQAEEEGKH